jgi:hypothetical protein
MLSLFRPQETCTGLQLILDYGDEDMKGGALVMKRVGKERDELLSIIIDSSLGFFRRKGRRRLD